MDVLRCKTPELVRKEIWTHILAYNLVRTIMAQAAYTYDIEPRTISFKGTLQILEAFQPLIAFHGPAACNAAPRYTGHCSNQSRYTSSRIDPIGLNPA